MPRYFIMLTTPAAYEAAIRSLAFRDRSALRLTLAGRAPEQILAGLVSGRIPHALTSPAEGVWLGDAAASTILTPKGRILAELRLLRVPPPTEGFLALVPEACANATLEHLRKVVPPRLAKVEDVSAGTSMITVMGPDAADAIRELLGGAGGGSGRDLRGGAGDRRGMSLGDPTPMSARPPGPLTLPETEGGVLHVSTVDAWGAVVIRTAQVATPAFDLFGSAESVRSWREALLSRGAASMDATTWETLRVEAGRPAFGTELDDTVIPTEAGIQDRAVDFTKGCFTGQEVLVRIRDRGHVNRVLRGLELGSVEPPARGTELFRPGESRAVGHITSAVVSPRFGQTIALGYVRREVEPPAELVLADGSTLRARDLETWSPR